MNIIFDQEKTDDTDLARIMEYGMQYVAVMDRLVDGKEDEPLDKDEYLNKIRPCVLKTIKSFSDRWIELHKENKERGFFNLNLRDFSYFLLAVDHHLMTNIGIYEEKGWSLLNVDIEQAKKDLEIVNKKLKLINDGVEAMSDKEDKCNT